MILRRGSLLILFLIIFLVYPIFVKAENIIDVPFISQYPPGTDWYHTKNCGPTSYLMIDSFYTSRLLIVDTIKSMDDWLFDKYGFPVNNYNGSLTDTKDIFNISLNFGDFYEEDVVKTRSLKDIKDAVNKGIPVIVAVYTNMRENGDYDVGHFMVLTGMTDDTVYVNDPGKTNGKNMSYTLEQFKSAWALQNNAALIFYPPGHKQLLRRDNSFKITSPYGADSVFADYWSFIPNIFDLDNIDRPSDDVLSEDVLAVEEQVETVSYEATITDKNKSLEVEPGQIVDIKVVVKNTGNTVWQKNLISLNVIGGKEVNNKYYHSSWKTHLRPTILDSNVVSGAIGSFSFKLQVPEDIGSYDFKSIIVRQSGTNFTQVGGDVFSLHLDVAKKEIEVEEIVIVDNKENKNFFEKLKGNVDDVFEKVNNVVEDVVYTIKQIPTYFGGGNSSGGNTSEENKQTVEQTTPDLFFTIDNSSNVIWLNTNTSTISGEKSVELNNLKINDVVNDFTNSSTTWFADVYLEEGENIFSLEFFDSDLTNSVTGTVNLYLDTISPETPVLNTVLNTNDSPQIELDWQSSDEASGLDYYVIEYKYLDDTDWQTLFENTTSTSYIFPVDIGSNYQFRAQAYDVAGNISNWSSENEISVDWSKEVVINEIAYAPTSEGNCGGDWVELYNPELLDLSGWIVEILSEDSFSTVNITSSSTEQYFVVSTLDIPDSGAQIILKNSSGKIIDESNQSSGWFVTNNFTHARSLERLNNNLAGNLVGNWRVNNSLRFSLYNASCGQDYSSKGFSNYGYNFLADNLADNYIFDTSTSSDDNVLTLNKDGNPYILDEKVIIPAGYTLVLDPGVVVVGRFNKSYLEISGNLIINGSGNNPVYFTSSKDKTVGDWGLSDGEPVPGDWSSIVVKGGGDLQANYTNFWYGGQTYRNGDCFVCYAQQVIRNEGGSVVINNSNFTNMLVKADYADNNDAYIWNAGYIEINNSIFDNGYRVLFAGNGSHVSISGSTFRNFAVENISPLYLGGSILDKWQNNIFENNSVNTVVLPTLEVTEDYTLTADYSNVFFDGINVSPTATLTIAPGAYVNINTYKWLKVEGSLQALGTADNHIRVCLLSSCSGIWFSNSSGNNLSYVDVRNAGYQFKNDYPYKENQNYTAAIWTVGSEVTMNNVSVLESRRPTGYALCSVGSNLNISNSEFGWSADYSKNSSWIIGGMKLRGDTVYLDNVNFSFLNYAIEAKTGDSIITYDNMTSDNFVNMYYIPHHNQNWLPYNLFPFTSYSY